MQINAATMVNCTMVTQKTKVKQPYDPAVPVLSIYLGKKKPSNLKRYMHFSVHRSSI